MPKYEKQAAEFCEAIRTLANTPENLAAEMKEFAEMER